MPAPVDRGAGTSMDDVIQSALTSTLVEQGVPESEIPRDEHGRFSPRDEGDFSTDPHPADPAKAKPAEAKPDASKVAEKPAEVDPDAPVVLKAADPEKLATKFVLKDETGELAVPEGLMVEFTANGKARTEPLDKVVKFAQMGVYNHEREQRLQDVERETHEVRTYAQDVERRLQERDQQMEWLLRDPAFREQAVQEYEAQNTPDMQRQRLEREREQLRGDRERGEIATQGKQYLETQVAPAVDVLIQSVPNVSPEEVTAKLMLFVERQKGRNGLVHPTRYDAISQYFLSEVVPWAQQLDEHRAQSRGTPSGQEKAKAASATQAQDKTDLEAAQIRAQRARRQAAANLKPPGRLAVATPAKKAPVTQGEIMDDVISSTLAAMHQG